MAVAEQDSYFPDAVTDPAVDCSNPQSLGTRGVYTVVTDVETGRSYPVVAFRTYLQQNVSDPNRPDGHMYVEFLVDTSKSKNLPHNALAQDKTTKLPFPAWSVWWRCVLNGRKMLTKFLQFGYPNTGQDAILEQNVC